MSKRFLGAVLLLAALLAAVTACTQSGPAPTPTPWPTTAVQPTTRPTATDARGVQRPGPVPGTPYDARDLARASDGMLYAACLDGAYRFHEGEWQRLPGQPTGSDGAPLQAGCLLAVPRPAVPRPADPRPAHLAGLAGQGYLLIGYDRQTLGIWDGTTLRTLSMRSDPRGAIFALATDPAEQTLYVGSHTAVQEAPLAQVWAGGQVAWAASAPAEFGGQPQLIYALAATGRALFLGNQEGAWVQRPADLAGRRDGQWQRLAQVKGYVNCIRRTPAGVIVGTPPGLLVSVDEGQTWATYQMAAPADTPDYPDDVLVTDTAIYATAVSSGLYVWPRDPAGRPTGTGQLVRAGIPECLALDDAGGLWLGDHAGLAYVPAPLVSTGGARAWGTRPTAPGSKTGLAAPPADRASAAPAWGAGCPQEKPGCPLDCHPDGYNTELWLTIYTADTGVPLSGVTVVAWQKDNDGGFHDLGIHVTGADGQVYLVVNCNWGVELQLTPPDLTKYQARRAGIGGKGAGMRNGCTCYPCLNLQPVPHLTILPDIYRWCPPRVEVGWEPPYPVVVGQDPERVGTTLIVTATVYDLLHIWGTCRVPLVNGQCPEDQVITHTEWIPDSLDPSGTATYAALHLTEASQRYIMSTLAERYPGIHIYQADWPFPAYFVFEDRAAVGGCPGQRFVARQNFPLADPGDYDVHVHITTLFPPESLRGRPMSDGTLFPGAALSADLRRTLHVLFVRQRLEQ